MKNKNTISILFFTLLLFFSLTLNVHNIYFQEQSEKDERSAEPILSDVLVGNYTVPGVSGPISLSQVLKIGILDDMTDFTGDSAWKGAMLAAREINEAGGILINGTTYYVGLVAEDTEEADPYLVTAKAVAAAQRMVNIHDPYFVSGGFRSEALLAYREVIMEAKIPFICTGCPDTIFCEDVRNTYSWYKYFFRCMPTNGSSLFVDLFLYTLSYISVLDAMYGMKHPKIGILREDLMWTDPIATALNAYFPLYHPNATIVRDIAFDITLNTFDMLTHLNTLESDDAQIVLPLITGPWGIYMTQQYESAKPQYLLSGINVRAQSDIYWDDTEGACRYEITMQPAHNTSKTPLTMPFWNAFIEEYGNSPYYTGVGSYDAVRLLVNATIEAQSFNSNTIVSQLETINKANPFVGAGGNISFTGAHDLQGVHPYGYSLFCQWQMDGNTVVLPSFNMIYPDSLATGSLSIPYWGINDLVADFSHELPGDFILGDNADDPDPDGIFDLIWTDSDGADSYSIYRSDNPITYISKKYTSLVDNNAISPYSISGLKTGEYYFIAVAYNGTGQKLSNDIQITVQLPAPGDFILDSDADDPDPNGAFNLIWTDSDGADNYSVYGYNKFITEINESLTLIANQNASSPFPISGLSNGEYYYMVVAFNGTGQTMSDCIQITVQFPPPGDFILTSNAGDPDTDGDFYLSWTDSDGADNYSLYTHDGLITVINWSVSPLAYQTATSPFPISGLSNGEYYYIAVAHNQMGQTMSNCIHITVHLPKDGDIIIPGYNVIFLISILLGCALLLSKKLRKLIK